MARPRKVGLDYFPLDCVLDIKVEDLRAVHGNDGFAAWIIILQEIYQTENGELDCSGVIRRITLAKRTNISEELWNSIVETCVEVGLFDSERWKEGVLTSHGIKKRLAKINEDREKARSRSSSAKNPRSSAKNPRKTGESKRESNKEKDSTPPTPPDESVVVPDDETFRTAMAIYDAYPLPSNQQWALRAIRDAARRLTASGEMSEMQAMTYLLERTKAYAAIVKQAPIEQRSYAPAPARWFEEERFFDADETWRQRFRVGAVGNGAAAIGDYHAYGLFTRAESQNEFRRIKASGVDDPKFDTYDLPEGVALDGDTFLVRYRNSKLPPVPETLARLRPQKHAQGRFSPAPAPTTHPAAKNAVTELTDACNGTPNGSGAAS